MKLAMNCKKSVLILSLIILSDSLAVKVFDTSNDVTKFLGKESGLRLKLESNIVIKETTICFRFLNYKMLNDQILLQLGPFHIGTSLSKDNSLHSRTYYVQYWPENDDIVTTLGLLVADKKLGYKILINMMIKAVA